MKIAIDIGHANNTGSRGNGLEEHAVAVTIAERLAPMLQKLGPKVDVIDFPGMSNAQDLNATIKAANEGGYDFGISLHCDASDNPQAHGAHVCFTRAASRAAGWPYASRNLFPACFPAGPIPCSRVRASPS